MARPITKVRTEATNGPERDRDDRARWAAVLARDKAFDATFYYSVATTGVYCRPSCPARRPKRENVQFHATPAEAEAAGFRPCKRCRPDARAHGALLADKIVEACRSIERADEAPTLAELARIAGLSPHHFHRVFKAATGVTPKDYAKAIRGSRMRENLALGTTVTEAIYASGFKSAGGFYEDASDVLGMTPSRYRAGGKDMAIRSAVSRCSLGAILVAASETGICAIFLGDDEEALRRDLAQRFPQARLTDADDDFAKLVGEVVAFVDAPGTGLSLPLDVRGTAFQHQVWTALRDIPAGTTTTYAEVARRIGKPKSVRAVAGACAANPLAVVIPCHRVVASDGKLSGYRWGIGRKRKLLDREAK